MFSLKGLIFDSKSLRLELPLVIVSPIATCSKRKFLDKKEPDRLAK